jgi:soluble lytic murein transglycosylase-like protein
MKRLLSVAFLLFCISSAASATSRDREAEYYANAYADHYGIPRALVYAFIDQESGWNPAAVSSKGAMGLMQLMPATARHYGVRNPFSKSDNIGGGVRYLRSLLRQFRGDARLVAAAYYTGEDRVGRRGLALNNPQVVAYVEQVRQRYVWESRLHSTTPPESHP